MNTEQIKFMDELSSDYHDDPVYFVQHALGVMTWSKMEEILISIRDNECTAVRACHGSSKTYTAAAAAAWFYNTRPLSKVITTAPIGRQVRELLWTEINSLYMRSRLELEGNCMTVQIKSDNPDHFALGFATDSADQAEGFHAPNILYIFDEAKGIPQWMWDSAEGSMTGGECRWLAVSTTDGVAVGERFFNIFNKDKTDRWNKIAIDVFDLPSFTGERFKGIRFNDNDPADFEFYTKSFDDMKIQLSTPKWEATCKETWGEDSVLYETKCRGKITDQSPDCIIKLSDVQKMFANYDDPDFGAVGAKQLGVDVARFGDDLTKIYKRHGMRVIDIASMAKQDTVKISYKAMDMTEDQNTDNIKVDDTGVGGGVTDILKNKNYMVTPVNNNGLANDEDLYPDAISEMWFEGAKIIKDIACPFNANLEIELTSRKFVKIDKRGRRCVESKPDYKKRGFNSPDDADAFLLCFYDRQPSTHGSTTSSEAVY